MEGDTMSKVDDKTIKAMKKLRDSLDGMITLYEKDEEDVTEEEMEAATGKLIMALITMDGLK